VYEFLSSAEHKRIYFEERLEPNSCFGTIYFHSRKNNNNTMVINGAKVQIVLQNIFLCVQQKKDTHTGLQQLEGA